VRIPWQRGASCKRREIRKYQSCSACGSLLKNQEKIAKCYRVIRLTVQRSLDYKAVHEEQGQGLVAKGESFSGGGGKKVEDFVAQKLM